MKIVAWLFFCFHISRSTTLGFLIFVRQLAPSHFIIQLYTGKHTIYLSVNRYVEENQECEGDDTMDEEVEIHEVNLDIQRIKPERGGSNLLNLKYWNDNFAERNESLTMSDCGLESFPFPSSSIML